MCASATDYQNQNFWRSLQMSLRPQRLETGVFHAGESRADAKRSAKQRFKKWRLNIH